MTYPTRQEILPVEYNERREDLAQLIRIQPQDELPYILANIILRIEALEEKTK